MNNETRKMKKRSTLFIDAVSVKGAFYEESNDKKRGIVPGKAGMDSNFFHGSAFLYHHTGNGDL